MKYVTSIYLTLMCWFIPSTATPQKIHDTRPLYFCMAADEQYYQYLLNAIGSIHRYNFDDVGEIAVFDIGFTQEQRTTLSTIEKVTVYDVERTHPDLLKRFVARNGKRNVPGWYAWKPVVLKQALTMFDEVLYIDAGIELRQDVRPVFQALHEDGHILLSSIRNIKWMITQTAITLLELTKPHNAWLLEKRTTGLTAYLMGVTRARYQDFILPVYELSKDLRYFAEDGSNPTARHDQTLFSIYARRLKLKLIDQDTPYCRDHDGHTKLSIDRMFKFNIHRGNKELAMIPYIRYKKL